MDFDSPDVEKEFPGLYAELARGKVHQNRESEGSEDDHKKTDGGGLLIGKRNKDKKDKKDKGYVAFEGESSDDEIKSNKGKKSKAFKFSSKKEKNKAFKDVGHLSLDRGLMGGATSVSRESSVGPTVGGAAAKTESKKLEKESKKKKDKDKTPKEHKKDKLKSSKSLDSKHGVVTVARTIFGVPIDVAVERCPSHDGIEIPLVVRECIDCVETSGLKLEGIYRVSAVKSKVMELKALYDKGSVVDLSGEDAHVVASLLKLYLRDLPQNILTDAGLKKVEDACTTKDSNKCINSLMKVFSTLPVVNRLVFSWLMVHMDHILQWESINKMNVGNLCIVLSPTLGISHRALNAMFIFHQRLFGDVTIKRHVNLAKADIHQETKSDWSSDEQRGDIESVDSIEKALQKQEKLLAKLHQELNSGVQDPRKDDQIWEVQRVVTQLKRKLRMATKASARNSLQQHPSLDTSRAASSSPPPSTKPLQPPRRELSFGDEFVIDTRLQSAPVVTAGVEEGNEENAHKCSVFVPWQRTPDISLTEDRFDMPAFCDISAEDVSDDKKELNQDVPVMLKEDCQADSGELGLEHDVGPSSVETLTEETVIEPEIENDTKEDEEMKALLQEERFLMAQQIELVNLGRHLYEKVLVGRADLEKLQTEILEVTAAKQATNKTNVQVCNDLVDISGDSLTNESEEVVRKMYNDLLNENRELEKRNTELVQRIQKEREECVDIKVQIRLVQLEKGKLHSLTSNEIAAF